MESQSPTMGGSGGRAKNHNWGIKWTPDEDARLFEAMERFGTEDWKSISEHVATRDLVQCNQRWEKVLRPDLVKGKWTDQEDDMLRYHVMQGFEHWGDVAAKLPGRTSKQCRERWCNYLDPGLLKTPFSNAEDEQLCNLQRLLGNKWSSIARQMPGRTENTVKLRYNALVKAAANGRPLPATFKQKRKYSEEAPECEDFAQGSSQTAFRDQGAGVSNAATASVTGTGTGTVSPTSSPAASVLSAPTTLATVSAVSGPTAAGAATGVAGPSTVSVPAPASEATSALPSRHTYPSNSAPTGMTTEASYMGPGAYMLPPAIPLAPAKRIKFAEIDFFSNPAKVDELIRDATAGPVHPAYSQLGFAPYGAAPPPTPVVILPPYLMRNGMFYATAAYRHQMPMHLPGYNTAPPAARGGSRHLPMQTPMQTPMQAPMYPPMYPPMHPSMPHLVSPYATRAPEAPQRAVHVVGRQRGDEPRHTNRN